MIEVNIKILFKIHAKWREFTLAQLAAQSFENMFDQNEDDSCI